MAIYHLEAKVVSRGIGRSACAAAAYMSCSVILNDYDGIRHDYTRKKGLVWEKIFLPEYAPESWKDRSILWNAVEEAENTKDSRLAREIVVALPVELTPEEWKQLMTEYIHRNFVSDGMCADVCIHDVDGHNPHAHILLTVRPLEQDGTWQYKTQKEYLCVRNGEERGFTAEEWKIAQKEGWEKQYAYKPEKGRKNIYLPPSEAEKRGLVRANKYPKSTKYGRQNPITERWNSEEQLVAWRASWADMANQYLERANVPERIDHRSHAERGLDEKPTIHEGVFARKMEAEGKVSIRCEINRQIRADNKIIREMKALMKELANMVQQTIPEIARMLETLRENLIMIQYQLLYNQTEMNDIRKLKKRQIPLLNKFKKICTEMKEKIAERKVMRTEKEKLSIWEVAKQIKYSQQITTMTEDIEELKNQKAQVLAELGCENDIEIKTLESTLKTLDKKKDHLERMQPVLKEEKEKTLKQYTETLYSVAEDDLKELRKEQTGIRYSRKYVLLNKVHKKYGDDFNRRQFDVVEKEVDEKLPVREIPKERKAIQEKLAEKKQRPTNIQKKKEQNLLL